MTYISWRKQLILALVLFGLGSVAYWLEYKHKPEKETQAEADKKVFSLKNVPVQTLVLRNGASSVALQCLDMGAKLCKAGDTSKWELNAPLKLKADDANVNSLLSTLNNLSASDTIDLKEETTDKRNALLRDYGLNADARKQTSAREVELSLPSGAVTLYLGATHPIGEGIFALLQKDGKIDESKVLIIPSYFKSSLDHDLTYWRDKKVLALAAREVDGFHLQGPKGDIEGHRKDGQWNLKSKKEEFAGDPENIDSLLTGVTFISATSFASDSKTDAKAKAALKGAKKILSLTLNREKGSAAQAPAPVTLTIFEKTDPSKPKPKPIKGKPLPRTPPGKLYATVSSQDPLYQLEANAKDRLDKSIKDLRLAKLITSMERFTAKKLVFSGKPMGDSPLTLEQVDGKWVKDPGKTEVSTEVSNDKVQSLLDKLSGNRIKDFVSGKAIPKGEAGGVHLTLGDDKNAAEKKLVFWKDSGRLYGRDLGAKSRDAFLIDSTIQDGLPWNRDFFNVAAPQPSPSGKVK